MIRELKRDLILGEVFYRWGIQKRNTKKQKYLFPGKISMYNNGP